MTVLITLAVLATAGVAATRWIRRRQRRYKNAPIVGFDEIRDDLKTGDIILFHKTTRNGFLDALELDVLSPLVFGRNEFRHSGIILRQNDELFVIECADRFHSGHSVATYLTAGNGIRRVPLEPLLHAYNVDNGGEPHFGIKHIAQPIDPGAIDSTLGSYGRIDYLAMHRSAWAFLSNAFLPQSTHQRIIAGYRQEMMCSEFVHSLLNRCGALKDYNSKVFMPYYIENAEVFSALEIVKFSEIVRFAYSGSGEARRLSAVAAAEGKGGDAE
jgi:hypothetical protein